MDNDESGARWHMTGERPFGNGSEVLVVGLEWNLVDDDEPVVNIGSSGDSHLTPDEATALAVELFRLAALARHPAAAT
jgi:hypothetical protein